jgi:hypothetical protein
MQQIAPERSATRARAPLRRRRLTPDDVDAVLQLDRNVFPEAYWTKAEELHRYLMWAELRGENFSTAVFDGEQLVGYMIVIEHPSVFNMGDTVLFVLRLAVRLRYRRLVVPLLTRQFVIDTILAGRHIEGRLRETTSLRTVQRYHRSFHRYGGRITGLAPQKPIAGEQSIHFRAEHLIARDSIVWGSYQALAALERARRVAAALPRRALRKLCVSLPAGAVPTWARRLGYLELPEIEHP